MSHTALLNLGFDHFIYIHEAATDGSFVWRKGVKSRTSLVELVDLVHDMARNRTPPITIAANVMHFIATRQPFWDGNRRTAFEGAETILGLFGLKIEESVPAVEKLKSSIMWMTLDQLKEWIHDHLTVP
jgi:prophage maintenance system killer protein